MIGKPTPPEREAWEQKQVEAARSRMEFWRLFRSMAAHAAIMSAVTVAVTLAIHFLA